MHWSILAFSACSCCSSEQRALSRQKVSWVHGGFAPSHLGCLYASKCLGWGVGLSTILQGILCTTSPAALGLQSLATTPAALGGHPTPETVLVFPLCFEGRKDLIVCVAREGADLQAAPQPSAAACRVHTARPDSDTHMLWPISSWVDVSAKRFPSVVVPGPTQVQLDQG